MFRNMRRYKQAVTEDECKNILRTAKRGVLSVIGDNGYPYAVPVNFFYGDDGKIYLHGAASGHKTDAIKACDKVCFTVWNEGYQKDDWSWYITSVVVFGRAEFVSTDSVMDKLKSLGMKYYPTEKEVDEEIARDAKRVQMTAITIEHMTGKLVHEK
ncbi:MAG: pyridoxamine 5'-phosphate oxidase family protein [Ruminococcus sp.]|nr:pyridoxamine 5'-phosphate oxidase family protein [Ruminococcus sp.]